MPFQLNIYSHPFSLYATHQFSSISHVQQTLYKFTLILVMLWVWSF